MREPHDGFIVLAKLTLTAVMTWPGRVHVASEAANTGNLIKLVALSLTSSYTGTAMPATWLKDDISSVLRAIFAPPPVSDKRAY
jgi:hypothetical protein